uniref:Uncharacterized protein n=1 Tax=Halimeda minima TaxID=170427 RepID=A0A386AYZ4_9CHLO|nr:hypothetical protein [Halimeda minima]
MTRTFHDLFHSLHRNWDYKLIKNVADKTTEKTYEDLRVIYSREFYKKSKSNEALYSILCDLRRSSVENGGLSIGRKRLAEFGSNPQNGAEILEAERVFQKWKKTPNYPVNRHKKIDEETVVYLEELDPYACLMA